MKLGVVAVAAALAWVSTGAAGAAQEIVAVDTGPGVTVRVLLLAPTERSSTRPPTIPREWTTRSGWARRTWKT